MGKEEKGRSKGGLVLPLSVSLWSLLSPSFFSRALKRSRYHTVDNVWSLVLFKSLKFCDV